MRKTEDNFITLSDRVLYKKNIIGIFDIDNTSISARGRVFLNMAQKAGQIEVLSPDIPKSFIIYDDKKSIKVFISQLTPATIYKKL